MIVRKARTLKAAQKIALFLLKCLSSSSRLHGPKAWRASNQRTISVTPLSFYNGCMINSPGEVSLGVNRLEKNVSPVLERKWNL